MWFKNRRAKYRKKQRGGRHHQKPQESESSSSKNDVIVNVENDGGTPEVIDVGKDGDSVTSQNDDDDDDDRGSCEDVEEDDREEKNIENKIEINPDKHSDGFGHSGEFKEESYLSAPNPIAQYIRRTMVERQSSTLDLSNVKTDTGNNDHDNTHDDDDD